MATPNQLAIATPADDAIGSRSGSGPLPERLAARPFLERIEAGIFRTEERTELLGGRPVARMATDGPHDFAVAKLGEVLRDPLEPTWTIRAEKSATLGSYRRPLPDISVARGPLDLTGIAADSTTAPPPRRGGGRGGRSDGLPGQRGADSRQGPDRPEVRSTAGPGDRGRLPPRRRR